MSANPVAANIEEIFKCLICVGRLRNAHMCPQCSKMCCYECMHKWLVRRAQCPHCRSPLISSQLINCRFMADVTQELDKLNSVVPAPKAETCRLHSENELSYFCRTCTEAVCSDCAMFEPQHKGHEFERLSDVYNEHVEHVLAEVSNLRRRHGELLASCNEIDTNIQHVTASKEDRALELRTSVEAMHKRLDDQLAAKLTTLTQDKESMCTDIAAIEQTLSEVEDQLNNYPKSDFITMSAETVAVLRELLAKPMPRVTATAVPAEFVSEILPAYTCGLFLIHNFTTICRTHEVVYSDTLTVDGISWRLKVYPNGNGVARGTYLSVFLEMIRGCNYPKPYEYRIEMTNPVSAPDHVVVREYVSEFEHGECWGYNKFFRLSQLESDGFVSGDHDTITLRFFVRSTTYYQKCDDQARYIDQLEGERAALTATIIDLKKRYEEVTATGKTSTGAESLGASTGSSNGRRGKSSRSRHARRAQKEAAAAAARAAATADVSGGAGVGSVAFDAGPAAPAGTTPAPLFDNHSGIAPEAAAAMSLGDEVAEVVLGLPSSFLDDDYDDDEAGDSAPTGQQQPATGPGHAEEIVSGATKSSGSAYSGGGVGGGVAANRGGVSGQNVSRDAGGSFEPFNTRSSVGATTNDDYLELSELVDDEPAFSPKQSKVSGEWQDQQRSRSGVATSSHAESPVEPPTRVSGSAAVYPATTTPASSGGGSGGVVGGEGGEGEGGEVGDDGFGFAGFGGNRDVASPDDYLPGPAYDTPLPSAYSGGEGAAATAPTGGVGADVGAAAEDVDLDDVRATVAAAWGRRDANSGADAPTQTPPTTAATSTATATAATATATASGGDTTNARGVGSEPGREVYVAARENFTSIATADGSSGGSGGGSGGGGGGSGGSSAVTGTTNTAGQTPPQEAPAAGYDYGDDESLFTDAHDGTEAGGVGGESGVTGGGGGGGGSEALWATPSDAAPATTVAASPTSSTAASATHAVPVQQPTGDASGSGSGGTPPRAIDFSGFLVPSNTVDSPAVSAIGGDGAGSGSGSDYIIDDASDVDDDDF